MAAAEPWRLTLGESLRAIEAGKLTAAVILESCLKRIAKIEPRVGAFAHIEAPDALAGRWSAFDKSGPLKGLPLAVKDTIDVAGLPAERGSSIYRGRVAREDAAIVAVLRRAGLFPLGKTVTTEFAYFKPGKTANPFGLAHTPGGSSSGSAAAVAAGLAPASLGSQTAGSLIRPASYCGIAGFVATRGLLPLRGFLPLAHSFDAPGIMARSIEDIGLVFGTLVGGAIRPDPVKPRRLLAVDGSAFGALEPEMAKAFADALATLRKEGIEIIDGAGELRLGMWVDRHKRLMARESAMTFAAEHDRHREKLSPEFQALVEEGRGVTEAEHGILLADQALDEQALAARLADVDAAVAPAAPGPAPKGLAATGSPHMNRPWHLFGLPQMALPLAKAANGLPLGIQCIAARGADARLIAMAAWLERTMGWRYVAPANLDARE